MKIFISGVQKEFSEERVALRDFLRGDALLRRFFEPFLFEEVPAADRRADSVYLDEVDGCAIYLGLFGNDYGFEDAEGVSPTHREFDLATAQHKLRLIFVKGSDDKTKHPKMQALIRQAGSDLIRRRFTTAAELVSAVYAALVQVLEDRELIRTGPFDAAPCPKAALADLDAEGMARFIREAQRARGFPLGEGATPEELLTHLNLLNEGRPTNAALLLFGRQPQRFLIASEVKCAHFHGTAVAKPIPSYQVYKGTVFALVDQAVDFVMSKINLRVGTRAAGPQAPVSYEIPREVVAEAIVNAVAHRDYTSNGSVQVMLFADRLEIWNPGALPPSLTLEKLRQPHGSVPANPLLAEPLYLTRYIERMGTGTGDMIRRCREAGLAEPDFEMRDGFVLTLWRQTAQRRVERPESRPESQPDSRPESLEGRVLGLLGARPLSKAELSSGLGHKEVSGQLNKVIRLLLADQTIEYTIPDKPNSRLQKYRLTDKGKTAWAACQAQNVTRLKIEN
ncbi:MAG: ATP-binding protein [Kiritimatiellae bacterium]|nr:ATP-binding protein [Kiritimatiellia bacterium]MDD3545199.1 ATP-binding protein [Kiritimatiellia bacterium]MDD4026450.1 ATP-binding protein [Kiritimatiellia bacterium]